MSWDQGAALCDSLGYGLVTINDAQEEAFLRGVIGTSSWNIGLNSKAGLNSNWVWRNGTSSYIHWYPGQPDNYNNGNETCVAYIQGSVGWHDVPCSYTAYPICESLD